MPKREDDPKPDAPNPEPSTALDSHGDRTHPLADTVYPPDQQDKEVFGSELKPTGRRGDSLLRPAYELMSRRNDLARRLGGLVREMEEWAEAADTEEAYSLAQDLTAIYDRLGESSEASDWP